MSKPTVVKNCYACPFLSDEGRCGAPYSVIGFDSKTPDMYGTLVRDDGRTIWYADEDSPPHPHCPMQGRTIALAWPPAGGGA